MPTPNEPSGVDLRWGPALTKDGFTPVANDFLDNYRRLGITPTEAMVVIHALRYKWDARAPFPALSTLGRELGISTVQVRAHVRRLEKGGFVRRERKRGQPSRLHFDGLLRELGKLLERDRHQRPAAMTAEGPEGSNGSAPS